MKPILTTLILFISSLCFSQNTDENQIHFKVDQLATYHGGYANFNKYISENIDCKIKVNKKVKNEVILSFIVEKNGEIKIVEIYSEKPFACKDEIIRAIKECKAWKPALIDNLPVRSIVRMEVDFKK